MHLLTLAYLALAIPAIGSRAAHAAPPAGHDAELEEEEEEEDDDDEVPLTEMVVAARRLDAALADVEPSLGASTYTLSNFALESRAGGETRDLQQVLVQLPGVALTGQGELAVRSGTRLQYRINNVIVPEGYSDLADTLSSRFAQRVKLVTGALPAQYGLEADGVVAIATKSGVYERGGELQLYGGPTQFAPAAEYAASTGATNVYVSAAYTYDEGSQPGPRGSGRWLNDDAEKVDGFAYVDHIVGDAGRVSLVLGSSTGKVGLPHPRDLASGPWTLDGSSSYDSAQWGGHRRESTHYGVLGYLHTVGEATIQASVFVRRAGLTVRPDRTGDLIFTGVAQDLRLRSWAWGGQVEGVLPLGEAHTVRAGVTVDWERERAAAAVRVFPLSASGAQASDTPMLLLARSRERDRTIGAFLQDEWRLGGGLTFNYGARVDIVGDDAGGTRVSPRANLVWEPDEGMTFHAGYARYFAPAPEGDEPVSRLDLAGTSGGPAITVSDDPRAETAHYIDIGVSRRLGDVTLGLNAYWRDTDNLIGAVRVGVTSIERPFNFAHGRLRGAELVVTYRRGPFSAWANLTLAKARAKTIISGQANFTAAELAATATRFTPVDQDQRATASGGFVWRLGKLALSGDALYGSGLPRTAPGGLVNAARLPSVFQVNLAAVFRVTGLGGRPLDLRADVHNLTGRRNWLSDGTALGKGDPQWGERRGIFFGFEQLF